MLSFNQISADYPVALQPFKEFMLREYLQYKILDIIFESDYGQQLIFLGGTCLRIVHQNTRFSEDLDFDNIGLSASQFTLVGDYIHKRLEQEGYEVDIKTVLAGAFHCHIRFPALLYREGLSGHKEQKILIQLDTEPQHFTYQPEVFILNRFDVFTTIQTTPLDLLLSQKCYAILNRKRNKGRDFFDVVFLLGKEVKPNYKYLEQKTGIRTPTQLKEALLQHCATLDMKAMAEDVEAFLFKSTDVKKVELFPQYLAQVHF